jgi:hypothetical protein
MTGVTELCMNVKTRTNAMATCCAAKAPEWQRGAKRVVTDG